MGSYNTFLLNCIITLWWKFCGSSENYLFFLCILLYILSFGSSHQLSISLCYLCQMLSSNFPAFIFWFELYFCISPLCSYFLKKGNEIFILQCIINFVFLDLANKPFWCVFPPGKKTPFDTIEELQKMIC